MWQVQNRIVTETVCFLPQLVEEDEKKKENSVYRAKRRNLFFGLGDTTAAFTYYYEPVILQNNLTPLSIFRDLALGKRESKKFMFYFYLLYGVYTNIQK